jgi:hypothetical protein
VNKRSAVSVSAPNFLEPMKAKLVASMPAGGMEAEEVKACR